MSGSVAEGGISQTGGGGFSGAKALQGCSRESRKARFGIDCPKFIMTSFTSALLKLRSKYLPRVALSVILRLFPTVVAGWTYLLRAEQSINCALRRFHQTFSEN